MKMNFILTLVILLAGIAYGDEVAKVATTPSITPLIYRKFLKGLKTLKMLKIKIK